MSNLGFTREEIAKYYYGTPQNVSQNTQSIPKLNPQPSTQLPPINNPNIPDDETRMKARNYIQTVYESQDDVSTPELKPINNPNIPDNDTRMQARNFIQAAYNGDIDENGALVSQNKPSNDSSRKKTTQNKSTSAPFSTKEDVKPSEKEITKEDVKTPATNWDDVEKAKKIGNYYAQKEAYKAKYATTSKYAEQKKKYEDAKKQKALDRAVQDMPQGTMEKLMAPDVQQSAKQALLESGKNRPTKKKKDKNEDNYVVSREKYDELMKNKELAYYIDTLEKLEYQNADQDATVSPEWADTIGAKNITGGYTKDEFYDLLHKKFTYLNKQDLKDMAFTRHSDLMNEETAQYGEELNELGNKHPVLGSAASMLGTLGGAVEGAYNVAAGGLTGDDRFVSNMFRTQRNAPREGVKENIDTEIGKGAYDIGMGLGDMGVGVLTGSAPMTLAGNTANEAMQSAHERGSGTRKSALYGGVSGAADYFFNKIGLDKARSLAMDSITSSGLKSFLAKNAVAGLGEAGENVLQDVAQTFADNLINGKNSELRQSFDAKLANGEHPIQALNNVAREYEKQLLLSGATGFAMGSAMQGIPTIANGIAAKAFNEDLNSNSRKILQRVEDYKNSKNAIPLVDDTPTDITQDLPTNRLVENAPQNNVDRANLAQNNVVNEIPTMKENVVNEPINDSASVTETITPTDVNDSTDVEPLRVATENEELQRLLKEKESIKHTIDFSDDSNVIHNGYKRIEKIDKTIKEKFPDYVSPKEKPTYKLSKIGNEYYVEKTEGHNVELTHYNSKEEAEKAINRALKNEGNTTAPEIEQTAKNVQPEDIGLKNDNTLTVDMSDIPPMDETDITSGNESPGVERGLSKHMRDQGKMQMEGVADEVKADFVDNPDMYKQLSNKTTSDRATEAYNSGNGEEQFYDMLNRFDPAALPLGHQIAKDYSKAGNHSKAAEIYRIMGERLTKSGQFSQAAVLTMMKNDPMTALRYAQKEIDSLNANGREEFGKKWKDFELTDDEIKAFESIKPGDENAIKDMFDKLGVRIGKDYPVKTWDKLLEGRRVAMLFNARTNIRNIGANVPTLGMRWMSDRVEALGQNLAHLIKPDFEVTQSVRGSGTQGRKIANEAWNTDRVKALVEGTDGKYKPEIKSALLKNKQVFKGTAVEKWLNRVTDGGIEEVNKVLFGKEGVESIPETIRNATYKMLELGDSPFVKENFVERLGSYIRAQGIKNVDDIPDAAIETAWEEAMKATYKDDSWAVQMLRGVKTGMEKIPGIGKPLSQTAIPFLQAPGNIAARMVDYSPIKATKGVMDIISGAVKGSDDAVRKGIEEAAKGLTGSGMIILGMKLHNSGLLTGDYSEDKDQKNFQKEHGFKPFALRIKDRYYTYDWAQPFAEPMIIGTLLDEAIHNSDQYDSDILNFLGVENSKLGKVLGAIEEGGKASVNSWFNASPLQGLASLMRSDFTGNQDIAGNTISSLVENFGGAFVPSVVNATAKTIDTTQRNTYDPSNKVNNFINQQVAKIPFLSMTLPAKYDVWGEKVKNADNQYEAFAQRFLVPGEYSKDKNDSVDNEINRLFNETEEEKVFPMVAPNSVDGNKLDNKQVSEYQKDVGTRNRSLVEGFMDSEAYQRLADDEKVEVIGQLYGASKLITERDIFGKPVAEKSTYKSLIEAYDNAGGGQKGVDAMLGVIKAKNNEYGLSADTYNEMVANGASEEEMREAGERATTLKDLGMTSESKSFKAAYENDQMDLYEDYRKYLKDNDMRDSEEHWGDYQRQRGIQPAFTGAESFGQEKKESWNRVQRSLPNTTEEEFSKTFDDIDRDGHGDITQDEFIRYLIREKYTNEADAQELAKAYGNWKKIPVLENKKWVFKKKK